MNNTERRATLSLASIYALRMFGLFLIIPVFSILSESYTGSNTLKIGLAIGVYGLTQAIFYFPFGIASDKWGRKPVILFGLILFLVGSLIAASAKTIEVVILGRAIQGSGAISSAVAALLSDLTSDNNRSKAMAIIGISICLSFFLAFMIAPPISKIIGLRGIFLLIAILTTIAIAITIWIVPEGQLNHQINHKITSTTIIKNITLLRLNFGVFVLHANQSSLFILLPQRLKNIGIPLDEHWCVYLPILFISFILMYPMMRYSEKKSYSKEAMLFSIALMLIAELYFCANSNTILSLSFGLVIYFTGFNLLEALQPTWVSRLSPKIQRGAAMGVYNTAQALGFFFGGIVGGTLLNLGEKKLFFCNATLLLLWFITSCYINFEKKYVF